MTSLTELKKDSLTHSQRALLASISVYIVADSASIRLNSLNLYAYALLMCVVIAGTIVSIPSLRQAPRPIPLGLAAWSIFMGLQTIQWPFPTTTYSLDQVTDLVITLLPAGIFVVLSAKQPPTRALLKGLMIVGLIAYVSALVAWIITPEGIRFESPGMLALAAPWIAFTQRLPPEWKSHRILIRSIALPAVLLMLPLTIASGSRTATATWVLAGLISIALRLRHSGARRVVGLALAASLALLLWVSPNLYNGLRATGATMLSDSRLATLATGTIDASTIERIREVDDVRSSMRAESIGTPNLVGLGHGATFVPYKSNIQDNIDPATGRVHNIHVTPVLVWFRYGIVGVLLFAFLLGTALVRGLQASRASDTALPALMLTLFLCYTLDLTVRNSLADPVWALGLAVILSAIAPPPTEDSL